MLQPWSLVCRSGWVSRSFRPRVIPRRSPCARSRARRRSANRSARSAPLFSALTGLSVFNLVRGELRSAHEFAERCLVLAERSGSSDMLVEAHVARGSSAHRLGHFASARVDFEKSIALYDVAAHGGRRAHSTSLDPKVAALMWLAPTLWALGYPDQALTCCAEVEAAAREISHPFSQCFALQAAVMVHELRREPEATEKYADALIALAADQGFRFLEHDRRGLSIPLGHPARQGGKPRACAAAGSDRLAASDRCPGAGPLVPDISRSGPPASGRHPRRSGVEPGRSAADAAAGARVVGSALPPAARRRAARAFQRCRDRSREFLPGVHRAWRAGRKRSLSSCRRRSPSHACGLARASESQRSSSCSPCMTGSPRAAPPRIISRQRLCWRSCDSG